MDLLTSYLESIAKPSMMSPDELRLTNNLIRELVELVHERYVVYLPLQMP